MSLLNSIGKGFRFFLMSMGISTYAKKPKPLAKAVNGAASPPAKPE